jgi:hypothetical protein
MLPHSWPYGKALSESDNNFLKATLGFVVNSPHPWRDKKALKEPYINNPRCNRGVNVLPHLTAPTELNIIIYFAPTGLENRGLVFTPGCTGGYSYFATYVAIPEGSFGARYPC